jgi:cytochrome c
MKTRSSLVIMGALLSSGVFAQDPYSTAELQKLDPLAGEQAWQQYCAFCHTAKQGDADIAGPNLHKLFQRKVGSKRGFDYSEALASDGRDWTPTLFAQYVADPGATIPGNRMPAVNIPADKVAALTAYVLRVSGSVDWDAAEAPASVGGLDADLRTKQPEFWALYMENTVKFTLPRDNGETYSFVAYFNEDGTISGNNRGLTGIWRMRDKRTFCYALERAGVHPYEWMHCLQPKVDKRIAFGETAGSFAPVKGKDDFQIEYRFLEGRPHPLEGDAHPDYWTFLFSTTTRYEIKVDGKVEVVDAWFNPDKTITSAQGASGTWLTQGEDGRETEMCYSITGVAGVDGELSECFALVLMFNPRVGARWPSRFDQGIAYWAETVAGR